LRKSLLKQIAVATTQYVVLASMEGRWPCGKVTIVLGVLCHFTSFGAFSLREVQRNGDLYNQEPGYLSFTAHDQRCHLLQPMWFAEFSSRQILRELRYPIFE